MLLSVDFADIEAMQSTGRWDEAGDALAAAATVSRPPVPTSCAVHEHHAQGRRPDRRPPSTIPLLHLADTTADAVLAAGMTRVGLLGTAFTMEQEFYRDRLAGHGLDVVVPGAPTTERSCTG